MILTLTSCLQEGSNGCPDFIRITFVHEGTTKGYDEVIGNDVDLRIYKNNIFYSRQIIPYEEIKGGNEYLIKKEFTGEVDIIAWAIPTREQLVGTIPDVPESGEKIAQRVTNRSIGHLYLGKVEYQDNDISQQVKVKLPMNDCIARFTAAFHTKTEELESEHPNAPTRIDIHGTTTEMDINFTPTGEEAVINVPFVEKDKNGVLRTAKHALLPAATENTFLTIKAYKEDIHLFTITTNHIAQPGDNIHVDIYSKHVNILINDWRIFDQPIEWI